MITDKHSYLVDKPLEQWLKAMYKKHRGCFPSYITDVVASYKLLSDYLNDQVHSKVVEGDLLKQLEVAISGADASLADVRYLNDHGQKHVSDVINVASQLLIEAKCELAPFEGYLLLLAIHFHDVGIIYGREQHEQKCMDVMNHPELKSHVGDSIVQKAVRQVASAHGGKTRDGSWDTIGVLSSSEIWGVEVRLPFLAAVVRFADELSDGRGRASRFMQMDDTIPEYSRIFHAYSHALASVRINAQDISLVYELTSKTIDNDFVVHKKSNRFLFDEILLRLAKMHQERIYCMRFWPSTALPIKRIRAKIDLSYPCGDVDKVASGVSVPIEIDPIRITLEESGYPGASPGKCDLCQSALPVTTGAELRMRIRKQAGKEA